MLKVFTHLQDSDLKIFTVITVLFFPKDIWFPESTLMSYTVCYIAEILLKLQVKVFKMYLSISTNYYFKTLFTFLVTSYFSAVDVK